MLKKKQTPNTYDEMFQNGGYKGCYNLSYKNSPYYPMYKQVLRFIKKYKKDDLLEVGCGSGAFAKFILDKTNLKYKGFDFSRVAIEKSCKLTQRKDIFKIGDATQIASYEKKYSTIVCTEVLEHITEDLECIKQWRRGTFCVCSVPNYDSEYHERYFSSEYEIYSRYSDFLDIHEITRVKKPVLSDLSFLSYLQYVRWNRYRFKRLLNLMGFGSFERQGGWFIFVATKK